MTMSRLLTSRRGHNPVGLSLVDILSVGVDRMQRSFEPKRKQVEAWKGTR